MAGSLSTYAKAQVRKWAFSDASVTRPTQWFVALYTSAPDDDGGGVEVSDSATGYARQEFVPAADGSGNAESVVFGPALTNWGAVGWIGVFTETGDFWAWQALDASTAVNAAEQLTFSAGAIQVVAD